MPKKSGGFTAATCPQTENVLDPSPLPTPPLYLPPKIINVTVEKCGALKKKKKRRGGWDPATNGKALINNPSAQPGANIAPIDEIVRVSLGSL